MCSNACPEQYLTALFKQEIFVERSIKVGRIFNMTGEKGSPPWMALSFCLRGGLRCLRGLRQQRRAPS